MNIFELFILLLQLYCILAKDDAISYRNYRVYEISEDQERVDIPSNGKVKVLKEYQVKSVNNSTPKTVKTVLVAPSKEKAFLRALDKAGAKYNVSVSNLEDSIKEERKAPNSTRRSQSGPHFEREKYYSYDEIIDYVKYLEKFKNPATNEPLVEVEVIGETYEARDMYLVKISSNHSDNKPIIFFEAGIHAREWTAPAAALYMMNQLVENFTYSENVLNKIDFYIIPVSNPDGYEYSRSKDRLWRKTRSFYNNFYGTDANRNFDFHWGEAGTSTDPSSDIFKGPYPFSEAEARNIRDIGVKYKDRIKMFVAIHAYGPVILFPWGYSGTETPPQVKAMEKVASAASKAIKKYSGTDYNIGPSSVVMYPAAGGSDDYFKGVLGVDLAFTVELSSAGEKSFIVPSSKLPGIVSEAFEGFKIMAFHAATYKKKTSRKIRRF